MNHARRFTLGTCLTAFALASAVRADNPLVIDQFTADPSAKVFGDRVYVYPSHDIPPVPGKTRADWFCMEDYHVFSSDNLLDWTDHGVIVDQKTVPWVNADSYAMWAPDCAFKNGKYYFYFPAPSKTGGRGSKIGVAISDSPSGPFTPQPTPIEGVTGIDPNVFIDKDGKAYLFYSLGRVFVAKLKDNMLELDGAPKAIDTLPKKGLVEGPFTFERNGIYYLTYPHVEKVTERLEYATSDHPMGPYTVKGVIMDETPGCWTNHQSIAMFKGQWYLFYHQNNLSPKFDKNRSMHADVLNFNDDGTIQKVIPTLRGVGIAKAQSQLQIDRHSALSAEGAAIAFIDDQDKHKGWKVAFTEKNAWARYDRVEFGSKGVKSAVVRVLAPKGGRLAIHLDSAEKAPLCTLTVPPAEGWQEVKADLLASPEGLHGLAVSMPEQGALDVDWVKFD